MIKIKNYLKALNKYENENHSFDLLLEYLTQKNSDLTKFYCEGEIHLPSFILIKKLHKEFSTYSKIDQELDNLFSMAVNTSKIFYSKLWVLIYESKQSSFSFDQIFEENIQPIGQQLINLLVNIKYKIKVIRIQSIKQERSSIQPQKENLLLLQKLISTYFGDILYKITLLKSTHHTLIKRLYYALIISSIGSFWLINFLFLDSFSPISSTFINIIAGVAIVIMSIVTYPIGDFGKIDISGRNIVAYKYKTFFNSHSSNIMLNVFSIQNTTNAGHKKISKIRSQKI